MRAKTAAWLLAALLVSLVPGTNARAGIFLGGSGGWVYTDIYKSHPIGSPYLGGFGRSYEAGFDIGRFSLSGELGPSYNAPPRHIVASRVLGLAESGKYRLLLGNLMIRVEPIDQVQPYFLLGGGQGRFTIDYGKGMQRGDRFLKNEVLSSWVAEAGFGFESPLRSWLHWGFRARFLYDRWKPKTDANLYPPYKSGNGYSIDLTLRIHI